MPDQEQITPNLASSVAQGGVADAMAGSAYSGVADAESAGEIAFGGPTADFILYGVVNGAFAQGPPEPTANIEPVNNPMPYWSGPTQVSGGAITATWVVDAGSPSGYNLRFTLNAGATDDEAYFQQIVPIGGARFRWIGGRLRGSLTGISVGSGAVFMYIAAAYLDVTGAEVGTPEEQTTSVTIAGDKAMSSLATTDLSPPATAYYLRIRLGMRRNTVAVTDTAVVDVADLRHENGRPFVVIPDTIAPETYGYGYINQASGRLSLTPALRSHANTSEIAVDADGDITLDASPGAVITSGGTVLSTLINPTVSGTVNDWAPTGIATCSLILVDGNGASRTITGFDATDFVEGQFFYIFCTNVGGGTLTFASASGSSLSGNRIGCPNAVNYVAPNNYVTQIIYLPSFSAANPFRVVGTVI